MTIWLLLCAAFLVQEPISSNVVLFQAVAAHDNVWIIHGIFLLATLIDVVVGYYLGKSLRGKFSGSKFALYLERKSMEFSARAGHNGKRAVLLLATFILFPLSTLFAPWLDVSFAELFAISFLSELFLWYVPLWLIVLGIDNVASDQGIVVLCAVILVVCWLGYLYVKGKLTKKG